MKLMELLKVKVKGHLVKYLNMSTKAKIETKSKETGNKLKNKSNL